jgi:hypothetical protein
VEKDNIKTILSMLDDTQTSELLGKAISRGEFEAAKAILTSPKAKLHWYLIKSCCKDMEKTPENIKNICELVDSNEVFYSEHAVSTFFDSDKLSSAEGKLYLRLLEKKIGKLDIQKLAFEWINIRLGGLFNMLGGAGHSTIVNKYANKLSFILKMLNDKEKTILLKNTFFATSIFLEGVEAMGVKNRARESLREIIWPIFLVHCKELGMPKMESFRKNWPFLVSKIENEMLKESTGSVEKRAVGRKTI